MGRVSGIRVHFEPNSAGEQIFEGLLTVSSIFLLPFTFLPLLVAVFFLLVISDAKHFPTTKCVAVECQFGFCAEQGGTPGVDP